MSGVDAELYPTLARQLVRAMRGRRSQKGFSARVGYRSNIAQRWESGVCFPTAADFLTCCSVVHPETVSCFPEFFKRSPVWFSKEEPFTPESVAAFLRDLRGKTPIGVLAERTGFNRYSVGRWLAGTAQPKLPEFLSLVEAASRRLTDFVATLVDPVRLPSLSAQWEELQAARSVAYEHPWSHAVLRALELPKVAARGPGTAQRVARVLGLSKDEAEQALDALERTGQVLRVRGKWRIARVMAVDTSRDEDKSRLLKDFWLGVARERLKRASPGNFGYSLFAVSLADFQRLRELQLGYVRAMQSLIASSEPVEAVGLYCVQLCDLGAMGAETRR